MSLTSHGRRTRVTSTRRRQHHEGDPMTPAEQAEHFDFFRSKHRGRARRRGRRRVADGDGDDPTRRRGAAEDGQIRYAGSGICAGRRGAPIRGPRIRLDPRTRRDGP
jgi:hypothetical protein